MRALLVFLLFVVATGCGQKGDLIAPEDPPVPTVAQPDAADDDDDEADAKPRRRDPP